MCQNIKKEVLKTKRCLQKSSFNNLSDDFGYTYKISFGHHKYELYINIL